MSDQRVRGLEAEVARLKALERDAARANRAKDAFLAILSHELRTPLNAILGWAQIVRSHPADEAMRQRGLQVIERNAQLQVQLIDDLLDASRILAGKMQVRSEPVDLRQALLAAVDGIRPVLETTPRDLRVTIDDELGMVVGDAARLQQVVWNLLSNAIKFTPAGGRIELSAERAGCDARIAVRDGGRGIDQESLPHVFEPYWQADASPHDTPGGLGLGLAVVRYLVEAHGGTVTAASAGEGCGAAFTVTLPLAAEQVQASATAGERRAAPPGTPMPR